MFCTKIGEISDISKCFENFVSQALGVLTRIYAAELRKYITLRTNIKKVRHTTNGALHFFRQIGQDLTFIA